MALHEVELKNGALSEVRITDRPLTAGEAIEVDGCLWRVLQVRRASLYPGAELRYVCKRVGRSRHPE